ncbi:peptidylprolyl isomerase [Pseudonocardia sp. HH130630-07]|uniref:peptidylprolyl isomerase n=1 Tax=Pseudonocardia sp. HH130630-07 TaxID=1690815 RepID=UPI00081528A4|nr:peptidylprolyl isomerase [Pseudonocardia sp. HH130630-07]ANY09533.1 peptidylprolyl isomerase [Pseudonocardia sp. HH130630-07]
MATNEQRRDAAKRKLAAQEVNRTERAAKRRRTTTISVVATVAVVAIVAAGLWAVTSAWSGPEPAPEAAAPAAAPAAPAAPGTVNCSYSPGEPAAKPVQAPPNGPVSNQGTVPVTLTTSAGPIDLTLDRAKAPCTVASFESLVAQDYFTGTSCHRLTTTPGLQVLQCGDPTGRGSGGPGYSFADELNPPPSYERGVLAMANAGPDTNGSQFFMIYGDAQLPPSYTAFGTIGQEGLATVDKVAAGGESTGSGDGAPTVPVEIQAAAAGQ